MRIVIVEDNKPLADGLAKAFQADGHGVDCLHDGEDASRFLRSETPDLIILDINLPGQSGLDVLKSLRSRKQQTPVLLLTARDAIDDKIAGLDLGADDYLTKPFDLAELKARARALLRRSEKLMAATVSIGKLELDLTSLQLRFNGEDLQLPRREYALAETLIQNKGRILSKPQILEHLYGVGAAVDETTVELYIHRLRKRIVGSGIEIKTVRGLGYCLRDTS
ncbi:MAG: response regulator transcription factor [Hyphomicrobiales bacterium]